MATDPRLYDSIRRLEYAVDESPELEKVLSEEGVPKSERRPGGLTIFVPNWNHETFLPRTLKSAFRAASVLKKGGADAEVLVVDDASRDGSLKLLRSIRAMYDPPMRVVALRRNYGQARLTNLALGVSSFRHVLRLDADNELVPENVPTLLESANRTGAALVYGNLIRMQRGEVEERKSVVSNMPATLHLTEENYVDALAIMDACEILDLGGYVRVNPYSPEDWEMNLHLVAQESLIVFVPVVAGYYRMGRQTARSELSFTDAGVRTVRRIYSQTGTREWDRKRVGRIYHPQVGFLDEWGY